MTLTPNQSEVLLALSHSTGWVVPRDIGAFTNSHHSDTLNRLARKGWVQFKQQGYPDPKGWENGRSGRGHNRGSKCYRITPLGREALAHAQARP